MIKEAKENDLSDILALYTQLFPEEDYSDPSSFTKTWIEILADKKIKCFLAYSGQSENKEAVASCIITIIPNLTRNQRPYAVIENVITHINYREQGFGKLIMEHAVDFAKEHNCYKVMLLSSSARREAHSFYARIGFDGTSKRGFQLRLP